MQKTKKEKLQPDSQETKTPKWWKKEIVAPLIVGITLSIGGLGIWIAQKFFNERYGELHVTSNVDSASVSLNQAFKGSTAIGKAFRIASLQPGTYVVFVQREGFASVDTSIQVAAGQITSIHAELRKIGKQEIAISPDTSKPSLSLSRQPTQAQKYFSLTVTVPSKFENAKIMIDHMWMANAPNTVRIGEGAHLLRVENDEFYYEEMLQIPSRDLINILENEFKSKTK